jgi:hypothetical protein
MSFLPFKSIKEFLAAGDYVYDASNLFDLGRSTDINVH